MTYKPIDIFDKAEQYHIAFHRLFDIQARSDRHDTVWPMFICSAFATELYLKCLILLETGTPARGHDLRTLFYSLTSESQQSIRKFCNARDRRDAEKFKKLHEKDPALPRFPDDFDGKLEWSRRAFVALRYPYERDTIQGVGWMGQYIKEGTRNRILELQPSWRTIHPDAQWTDYQFPSR